MTAEIHFRGGRQLARQLAYRVVAQLTGREPDAYGIARGVFTAIGFAALSDVKADFVRKASGQTGEDGNTWAPLKPATIARRRLGHGDKKLPGIADRAKAEKEATKAARQRFDAEAKERRKRLVARLSLSMGADRAREAADKQIAAERKAANFKLRGQIALAKQTGQRRQDVLAQRKVDILRDTGILLNSLSPGTLGGSGPSATYSPPSGPGGGDQVFDLFGSGVIVGTTVAYAKSHQEGNGRIPARPFLPTRGVPAAWLDRWAGVGQLALEEGVRLMYQTAT